MQRLIVIRPRTRPLLVALLAIGTTSCATAPSADLTGFGRAASALQADAATTFADANRLTRSVEVDRFVRSGAIALPERRFPPAVPPEVSARWRAALGDLVRYGNLLATLTGRGRGGMQTEAFRRLGVGLASGTADVDPDPGIAAGFASLAGALIDLRARTTAKEILRRTDPDVRRLLTAMAAAVGSSDAEGLRGTVASNWITALSAHQRNYAAAATEKADARQRQIVADHQPVPLRRIRFERCLWSFCIWQQVFKHDDRHGVGLVVPPATGAMTRNSFIRASEKQFEEFETRE